MSGRGMRVRESVPKQNFDACWPRWFVRGAARHGTTRHDTARQLGNQSSISTPEREAGSLQVAGRQQAVAATENGRKKKWQRTPIARAAAKDGHTDRHSHNRTTTTTTSTTSELGQNGEEMKGEACDVTVRARLNEWSGQWWVASGQWSVVYLRARHRPIRGPQAWKFSASRNGTARGSGSPLKAIFTQYMYEYSAALQHIVRYSVHSYSIAYSVLLFVTVCTRISACLSYLQSQTIILAIAFSIKWYKEKKRNTKKKSYARMQIFPKAYHNSPKF